MSTLNNPPPSAEELQRRLRAGELSIEPAPSDLVRQYRPEINRILSALGLPEAWVTDESMISDFPIGTDEEPDQGGLSHWRAPRRGVPSTRGRMTQRSAVLPSRG